ncbi:MarR family transcriptional regulator [Paenibacillus campi]|uniref:MarR family transcriptional regulator n=1 Tax=Paenibacillus campi TaxID=3106031 RepID=UPI002AFF6F78|nr:MarR family transcriptional regulator [Paenibacillus sp. SGZ-1014]
MNKQEQVMLEFRQLFTKMAWLNRLKMEAQLHEHKPSEVHCIEYIGKHPDCNVTRLAEFFYMTRSAISKMTKKLLEKGLIESYQKPDNKKEIYFRLTAQGKEIERIHEQLHQQFQQRDAAVFADVTDEQYATMLEFIQRYSNHLDKQINTIGRDEEA